MLAQGEASASERNPGNTSKKNEAAVGLPTCRQADSPTEGRQNGSRRVLSPFQGSDPYCPAHPGFARFCSRHPGLPAVAAPRLHQADTTYRIVNETSLVRDVSGFVRR
jgi:hypothetical protein